MYWDLRFFSTCSLISTSLMTYKNKLNRTKHFLYSIKKQAINLSSETFNQKHFDTKERGREKFFACKRITFYCRKPKRLKYMYWNFRRASTSLFSRTLFLSLSLLICFTGLYTDFTYTKLICHTGWLWGSMQSTWDVWKLYPFHFNFSTLNDLTSASSQAYTSKTYTHCMLADTSCVYENYRAFNTKNIDRITNIVNNFKYYSNGYNRHQ